MKGAEKRGAYSQKAEQKMLSDWERLQQSGVEFFVDGEAVRAAKAVGYAVAENHSYMADYVLNDEGLVQQIRMDRVEP